MRHPMILALIFSGYAINLYGYDEAPDKKFSFHGNIQSEILAFPQEDRQIGTGTYTDQLMTNTYAEFYVHNKYFQAGTRLEYLQHPLPGFDNDFAGWGLPYFYIKGKYKWAEMTIGDFYDQMGAGLIFRTYEDRALGIDNSLRGGRLVLKPGKGVQIKILGGQQRHYWHHRNFDNHLPWTYGGDLEINVDQWSRHMRETGTYLTLGFSGVSNHAGDEEALIVARPLDNVQQGTPNSNLQNYQLKLPQNVGAFDVRANLQKGNYNWLLEYAWKGHDPSSANNYTFNHGQVLLFSGSYSRQGMSVLLQAKRSEDMAFRSRRMIDKGTTACYINYLPPFTQQHTYTLMALYPYATQMTPGEWAFQGEVAYRFKRNTWWGGKYGMGVKANFSHVRGIEQIEDETHRAEPGYDAPRSHFFKMGPDTYFQDISLSIDKKISRELNLNFMYAHQRYNQQVVEGHGAEAIKSHILVAEAKYRLTDKMTLRGEAQYLHTRQDQKDWWYGLLELSLLPHLMFTLSDQYNGHVPTYTADGAVDEAEGTHKVHYLMGTVTYTHKAHRLQLGYGKTRAGYNCSGGVCRYVPAAKGLMASYSFNF